MTTTAASEPQEGRRPSRPGAARSPHSQTLDRGLQVLELLAEREQPLPVAQVAAALGLHRSIAYRIVRTLEDHRLVSRAPDGAYELGVGLAVLARGVWPTLHAAATPELAEVANELRMTAFLAVADRDQCLTLLTVEPRHSAAHVAYRPGRRHRLDRGGPGIALLAGGPPLPGERPEVTAARRAGHAVTSGEVIAGLTSVAAPVVTGRGTVAGAVAVLFPNGPVEDRVVARVCEAAAAIAGQLP